VLGRQANKCGECGQIYTLYTILYGLQVTTVYRGRNECSEETKINFCYKN